VTLHSVNVRFGCLRACVGPLGQVRLRIVQGPAEQAAQSRAIPTMTMVLDERRLIHRDESVLGLVNRNTLACGYLCIDPGSETGETLPRPESWSIPPWKRRLSKT